MLSRLVTEEIRARFSEEDAGRVVAALEAADIPLLPPPSRWRDRIYLGIIKVAGGDWQRFRDALRLAETDWRDLLVSAGLENADWPEVLAREGFQVP